MFLSRKKIPLVLLIGIMICGAVLRLEKIGGPSLWYDELFTVRVSAASLKSVVPETLASRHPPLYYLALHFWGLFGSGDAWVRLLSAAAGIVSIGLVYVIGKDLFSRRAGLWAAAFAAFSPFLVWYSRDATDYSVAIATTSASFLFLVKAARGNGWVNWGLYVIASTAALFAHYYNVFFLMAEVPLFLFLRKEDRGKLRPWLISEGILGALLVPWFLMINQAYDDLPTIHVPHFGSVLEGMGSAPVAFTKGYAGLVGRGEQALSFTTSQEIILVAGILAALVLILAGSRLADVPYRGKLFALTVFFVLTVFLPVFFHLAQGNLISGRYLAVAAPVFFLWLAGLINLLPIRLAWVPGGMVIILMLLFTNVQRHGYSQEDWRGIMNTVEVGMEKGDDILCFPLHHCVAARDYYLNPDAISIEGGVTGTQSTFLYPPDYTWTGYRNKLPEPNPITDVTDLKRELSNRLESTRRIWLVSGTGNVGNYPYAASVEQALSTEWNLQQAWDFTPLSLKLYTKS